ncbi:MAG: hypothetical protein MPJ24_01325 [Pirellulaceae bacterium]|nr:hypothetical protein [Pirellulaceae bacterium]
MDKPLPHYLLFVRSHSLITDDRTVSEDEGASFLPVRRRPSGRWHFSIESLDTKWQLEVTDHEVGLSEEELSLLAIIRGLEAIDQAAQVSLITSSSYLKHGLQKGLGFWAENDFQWERFGEMVPIKNGEYWKRIYQIMQIHQVRCYQWQESYFPVESAHPGLTNNDSPNDSPVEVADRRVSRAPDFWRLGTRGFYKKFTRKLTTLLTPHREAVAS